MIAAWSYSRYSTYKLCPLKAKLAFLDKIQQPSSAQMARGLDVHTGIENYIKGNGKLPDEVREMKKFFKKLKKQYARPSNGMAVEENWGFDKNWKPVPWNDWSNCVMRVKLDCSTHQDDTTLEIYDWKTGKFKEDQNDVYMEQMELQSLAAMIRNPHVQKVIPKLVYVDAQMIYPTEELHFTRGDIERLKSLWGHRTEPMLSDTIFAPRPNNLCGWCHYRKDNALNGGGQCEY